MAATSNTEYPYLKSSARHPGLQVALHFVSSMLIAIPLAGCAAPAQHRTVMHNHVLTTSSHSLLRTELVSRNQETDRPASQKSRHDRRERQSTPSETQAERQANPATPPPPKVRNLNGKGSGESKTVESTLAKQVTTGQEEEPDTTERNQPVAASADGPATTDKREASRESEGTSKRGETSAPRFTRPSLAVQNSALKAQPLRRTTSVIDRPAGLELSQARFGIGNRSDVIRLGTGTPPSAFSVSTGGIPGSVENALSLLRPASAQNLQTAIVNPASGAICNELARSGFFGGQRSRCESSFVRQRRR